MADVPDLKSAKPHSPQFVAWLLLFFGTFGSLAQRSADPLTRARQSYNLQHFDMAVKYATEAKARAGQTHSASLVCARAMLARFRRSLDSADIGSARQELLSIDPSQLSSAETPELHLAMAELLYADYEFGPAAELFEAVLNREGAVPAGQRERVLEWWAASVDRHAQLAPDGERQTRYRRLLARLEIEAARPAPSPVVVYWLAAATRGVDDPDRAWSLAIAGWIQAPALAGERAGTLRADLEKLMIEAIIPERVRRTPPELDAEAQRTALLGEWASIKERWSKSTF